MKNKTSSGEEPPAPNTKLPSSLSSSQELLLLQLQAIRASVQNLRCNLQNKSDSAKEKLHSAIEKFNSDALILESELLAAQSERVEDNISFVEECLRKSVHLLSLIIPCIYLFIPRSEMLLLLSGATIICLALDLGSKLSPFIRLGYLKVFGKILRKHEVQHNDLSLNGASWALLASTLTVYLFVPQIAVVSLFVLFLADPVAAIFGRRFGKRRFLFLKRKSIVGSFAFFIAAFTSAAVATYFMFGLTYTNIIALLVAAIVTTLAEALSAEVLRIDDNITIPITFGITLQVLQASTIFMR